MSVPKTYRHLERGLAAGTGLTPEEAARDIFFQSARYAESIEFSKDGAVIIDGRIVVRPSKSSGLAVDLK